MNSINLFQTLSTRIHINLITHNRISRSTNTYPLREWQLSVALKRMQMRKFVSLIIKNFRISVDKYSCTGFFLPEISFHANVSANFHNQIGELCREVENGIDGRASCRTPFIVVDGKRIRGFFSTMILHPSTVLSLHFLHTRYVYTRVYISYTVARFNTSTQRTQRN